ncbi:MBL fold metallo-hydrolase [sulfur-oxidizing endosymbiont of Gigantopelta aegis]|uniref:MBL fold metallo-hydrolase n=1 Tax=sulfur-oxidizing endosymbiont of Gigantopelta aegis TaxID=2794934 RepID=UPI0018DDFD3E|nr:MBL fold metallo-hydrolase [sulfur-oxidizing endosymbiont of Gigantopelta aegis]
MKLTFHLNILILLLFLFLLNPAWADKKLAIDKVKGPLSVMVLGSGGPVATAKGRASASYMIFTDGKPRVLMDIGGGAYQRLAASGMNVKDLDIILLSHLHIDHTGDLSAAIKTIYFHSTMAGVARTSPIHIFGPEANGIPFPNTPIPQYPDTTEYAHSHYDIKDGSERYLNIFASAISGKQSRFKYMAHDLSSQVNGAVIEEILNTPDGLIIQSIAVDHGPVPAVAFRVEYKGHSIVYSGDTGSKNSNMITISQNADLLIYDTAITDTLPANPVFHVLHTSPSRIGQVAAAAGVKKLLLSHITPVVEPRIKLVKKTIRQQGYTGKIKVAKDLKVYNLADNDDDDDHDGDDESKQEDDD